MKGINNESFVENRLSEMNDILLKKFAELKELSTPTVVFRLDIRNDTTFELYFFQKVTVTARVLSAGKSLNVKVDGESVATFSEQTANFRNLSLEKGKHTLTFCPSDALTATVGVKGAYWDNDL